MSKLEDRDRYYNWYHGFTKIRLPFFDSEFEFFVNTGATSGTISTQYFGDKFDAAKMERKLYYSVVVYPPASVWNNSNVTLHFDVEKVSMGDLSNGYDMLFATGTTVVESSPSTYNYSPPSPIDNDDYHIALYRNVIQADIIKQKLGLMPGFRFSWRYSGMEVEPEARFYNTEHLSTMAFVRDCSNNITLNYFCSIRPFLQHNYKTLG